MVCDGESIEYLLPSYQFTYLRASGNDSFRWRWAHAPAARHEHKFTLASRKASQSLAQSQVNKQDRKYQNKMIINMYEYVNTYQRARKAKCEWRKAKRDKNNGSDNKKSNESAIRIKPVLLLVRIFTAYTYSDCVNKTMNATHVPSIRFHKQRQNCVFFVRMKKKNWEFISCWAFVTQTITFVKAIAKCYRKIW